MFEILGYAQAKGVGSVSSGMKWLKESFTGVNWRWEIGQVLIVLLAVLGLYMLLGPTDGVHLSSRYIMMSIILVLGQHLFCSRRLYWGLVVFFSLTMLSVLAIRWLIGGAFSSTYVNYVLLWIMAMAALATWLINIGNRWVRALLATVVTSLWLGIVAFNWSYYFAEGTYLSANAILAVLQTNGAEAMSYASEHSSVGMFIVLAILLLALAMIVQRVVVGAGLRAVTITRGVLLLIYLGLSVPIAIHLTQVRYVMVPFVEAYIAQQEYYRYQALRAEQVERPAPELVTTGGDGLYVLVIGESETRDHMSGYGYVRQTTPWLDSMVASGEALQFSNAYACYVQTVEALSYALTSKNQYNDVALVDSVSLVDMARAAGFHTIWLSAQGHYGLADTPTTAIAGTSDEQVFINESIGQYCETRYLDEELINRLDGLNITGRTLLIVHLLGCHSSYEERYPQNMSTFGETDVTARYDNAVHYNDYVLSKLYARVKTLPGFKGMVFFSDHGEDLTDNNMHNAAKFTPPMARIPLYMLLADSYRQENPARAQALLAAQDKFYTNDLIYNTMLSLMGIRERDGYEPENDLLAPTYDTDVSRFRTVYGKVKIADIIDK